MAAQSSFDSAQLRGAYAAGFEAGSKEGIATMQREGWKRATRKEDIDVGSIVKTLTPTMSGWIGYGRVLEVDSSGVRIKKCGQPSFDPENEFHRAVDLCLHEVAYRVVNT